MDNTRTYYVGMSGGVDSTVVAYLLSKQGYKVKGVFANCFYDDEQCRNSSDHRDAVDAAGMLGIQLTTKDYRSHYSNKVLKLFYEEYANGRTPNPDILCNSEVKFGVMANDIFSGDPSACLATGHYVGNSSLCQFEFEGQIAACSSSDESIKTVSALIYRGKSDAKNFLFSSLDGAKDQSYFLYRLYDKTENLDRYVFPLSCMKKSEVRQLAASAGLDVASKPDSQGICFIGDIKIKEFIKEHIKSQNGAVVDIAGNPIGSHSGVQYYTIGQRHGFKIDTYSGSPLYIVDKNIEANILTVGTRDQASAKEFIISDCSFPYSIGDFLEKFNDLGLTVRVRNLGRKIPCKVSLVKSKLDATLSSDFTPKIYRVTLSDLEFGVSAGQSAVFYLDRLMLGGGVIDSVKPIS